jgi:hypothetical protein
MEVLVTAKKEYIEQLCAIISPHIIAAFQEMYEEAERMSKGKKPLIQFQSLLKDVKSWNTNIINGHTSTVCNSCSWFNDLLAAVFVSSVRILSAVRITAEKKKIKIKMPSNETFIQGVYENVARDFYKDPYIFIENLSDYEKDSAMLVRVNNNVALTVQNMIPIQEILKTNMSGRDESGGVDFDTGIPDITENDDDPEEMSDVDEEEGPIEEETPVVPDTQNTEDVTPLPTPAPSVGGAPEVKEIPLVPATSENTADEDDEEGVLFPGAPER